MTSPVGQLALLVRSPNGTLVPAPELPAPPPCGQTTRMPGLDAPCLCDQDDCRWPFCTPPGYTIRQREEEGE